MSEEVSKEMSDKMPKEVSKEVAKERINWWTFDDSVRSETNSFDFRQKLFDFGLDSDLNLIENTAIPRLKDEFLENKKGLDITLEEGMAEAIENKKMITNYDNHRKRKWIQFLKCLQKHKTIDEEEPTFVTFSTIISDFFIAEEYDTKFFAIKFNGVIYLFRNESLDLEEGVEKEVIPHTYYLLKFRYLISNKEGTDINGIESCQSVDRIDLNGNKLIVCHGIGGVDGNGSPVFVKCRQIYRKYITEEKKYRILRDWSNCVIDGAQTLIIGRRFRSTLQEVIVRKVDNIPAECRSLWSDTKRFSYVDQALEFIKSCIGSELELYEFAIDSKTKTLSCFRRQSGDNCDHFLPKFYTELDSNDNTINE